MPRPSAERLGRLIQLSIELQVRSWLCDQWLRSVCGGLVRMLRFFSYFWELLVDCRFFINEYFKHLFVAFHVLFKVYGHCSLSEWPQSFPIWSKIFTFGVRWITRCQFMMGRLLSSMWAFTWFVSFHSINVLAQWLNVSICFSLLSFGVNLLNWKIKSLLWPKSIIYRA